MSFFNKIFGGSDDEKSETTFWNYIESEEELNKAIEKSFEKKVAIFKHSTRCHISKTVLRNFESEVQNTDINVEYYFLDLLAHSLHWRAPQRVARAVGEQDDAVAGFLVLHKKSGRKVGQ